MKILSYNHKDDPKSDEKTGVILRKLEQLVCEYDYLVPGGWRFILKMQATGDAEPYYHIDIQSNNGGGSFAEAKMETLEMFTDHAASGLLGYEEIRDIIINCDGSEDEQELLECIRIKGVESMNRAQHERLRDKYGLTVFLGGIRIPYKDLIVEGDKISNESGEIRIAFSGASAEQDLFFALMVFRALNNSFVELYPNTQGWLDLRKLKEVQAANLWINLLDIREA